MTAQMPEARFDRYFFTNDQLSAGDLDDIRHYLARPKQELGEVDREIQDLERRLTLLRAKRETLHGEVRKYSGLCSPLRELPQDILAEIFVHCLPQDRHSVLHVTDAPILLTTICRRWRDIALHTPRLWTSFHVVTNSYGQGGPPCSDGLRRVTEEQLAFLRRCISRSGTLPLSFSLLGRSEYTPTSPSPVIAFIGEMLPRIRSLRWDHRRFDKFIASQSVDSFPLLETLSAHWQWDHPFDPASSSPSYLLAPNLREVRIHDFDACPSTLPLQWKQLTRLALPGALPIMSADKLADLLKACHNLQEGLFYVSGDQLQWGDCAAPKPSDEVPPPLPNSIPLPELLSLDLTHRDCIGALLRRLHAHKLTQLALRGDRRQSVVQCHVACLPTFMQHNEQCLPLIEKLVIRPSVYHPPVLVAALESLPRLRALVLIDKNGSSSYSPTTPKNRRQEFDEDMLLRMTPQLPPPDSDDPTLPPFLCPLLERFEFREGANYAHNRHLKIQTVVSFVSGKWDTAQRYHGRVSALKYITVPTQTLPNDSVKNALKPWREKGLVVEIAYPGLDPTQRPDQYEGAWEDPVQRCS